MPMDIRDFFKKKGTTTTGKKPSTAKKSAAVPSTASGKRSTGTTTTTAAAAAGKSSSSSNIRKTSKRSQAKNAGSENEKNQILMDEDLEPTKTSPAKKGEGPKLSPGKRRRIRVESDDEDYVEIISQPISPRKSSSPLRQKKATGHKIEVSASDYFAGASKASAVTQTTARTGAVKSPGPSPSKKMKPISSPPQEKSSSSDKTPSPVKSKSPAKRPSPAPKETSPPKASPAKKARASPRKEEKSLAPLDTKPLPSFSASQAAIECLQGYTFCITAVDPDWSREDATDFLKTMGARVTTAVSGKTDYLVVLGETLEDQRHYTEGSKYKQATERGTRVIVGKSLLNGVVKYHSDQKGGPPTLKDPPAPAPAASAAAKNPYDRKPSSNPYARKPSNPYERKPSNPYARKPATANPAAAPSPPPPVPRAVQSGPMLWVDKYKPASSRDILGNQEAVRKLRVWLDIWESNFNKDSVVGKAFSNPKGPWKAVLLSGPPGIGKTTTATLVAQESGRHVLEFNASDVRSKKSLKEDVGDITGSRTLTFAKKKQSQSSNKRVIIMDEVDGLGAGDRGGLAELIQMIKGSRVPIICICNDRQSQKIKSLVPYCMDLKYARPRRPQIAARIVEIARMEGFTVEMNAAERLAESCGNDVRQCLNACQMWASENTGKRMSYGNLKEREKSISKDEMLRVSLFDATRLILQGREGLHGASPEAERAHFLKRNDAFFVDYNFTGLMVQQNYVAILKNPYSKAAAAKQTAEIEDVLERMALASEAMSDFALAEHKLRSDQNWSVLPFVGSLTVKTGYHAGGERGGFLVGYPEFTAWLGKNSSKSKKARMIQELQHHMNFRISGGSEEMRLSYLPVLRTRFLSLLKDKGSDRTSEIIELMDEYGLNRDDIIERFDEFKMDKKDKGFSILDSKQKTALTKAYNAGSHKSQALVIEQGGAKKSKRKATSLDELGDPDVVDDDKRAESEEEEEELDPKAAALLFKKKGRRTTAKAGAKKKAAPKRKK